ncbi:MAG: glycoside hydrolase family 20 zincin-like fold domain-containing protein, partial [Sedimentisphaerales bacterium]|nr:glycoside hydrolase family 20 zincin-like fold domain-containing protein [Sedimentisphaerales bacterium]
MSAGMTFVMMIAMLFPKPQEVQLLEGAHKILPDRFILLKLDHPGQILPAGQLLQAALEKIGPRLELTASAGEDAGRIGAVLWLDPQQVPKAQGYRLTITPQQIQLVGHDRSGLFYGVQTLRQLARMAAGSGQLPCVKINDWPDFTHRGRATASKFFVTEEFTT